jgi:hypothetical protein
MKAVCEALGVARSNIAASFKSPLEKPLKRVGRPPRADDDLVRDHRRPADLWLSPRLGASEAQGRDAGPPAGQRQARSWRHESPRNAAAAPRRRRRPTSPRRHKIAVERSNLRWCSDASNWPATMARSSRRLRSGLLRSRSDGLCRDHARNQRRRCSRPHGRVRRISLRQGQPFAARHRMAQRRRLGLCRQRDASLRPRYRPGAAHDPVTSPQSNGMAERPSSGPSSATTPA